MNTQRDTLPRAARSPITLTMAGAVLATVCAATAPGLADEAPQTRVIAGGNAELILITEDGAAVTNDFVFAGEDMDDMHTMSFGDAHAVEVKIVDGDVHVKVDGEAIPAPQVLRRDGAIVVLDENGDEVRVIDVPGFGEDGNFGFHFEGGDGQMWFGQKGAGPLAEPKVMLGVHLGTPGPALEKHLGLKAGSATLVTALFEGLPADEAGLEQYDIITAIDGDSAADPKSLREAMAGKEPGDVLRLRVIHEGEPKTVRLKLAAYDHKAMARAIVIGEPDHIAAFGPNIFTREFSGPDGKSLFDFDFENVKELNRFFLDDSNRLFEVAPGRMRLHLESEEGEGGEKQVEVRIDSRLSTLDARLAALEEMLDALLAETKKDRSR